MSLCEVYLQIKNVDIIRTIILGWSVVCDLWHFLVTLTCFLDNYSALGYSTEWWYAVTRGFWQILHHTV